MRPSAPSSAKTGASKSASSPCISRSLQAWRWAGNTAAAMRPRPHAASTRRPASASCWCVSPACRSSDAAVSMSTATSMRRSAPAGVNTPSVPLKLLAQFMVVSKRGTKTLVPASSACAAQAWRACCMSCAYGSSTTALAGCTSRSRMTCINCLMACSQHRAATDIPADSAGVTGMED